MKPVWFSLFYKLSGNVTGIENYRGGELGPKDYKKQAFLPWTDDGRPAGT
jgi:hypothetical protein